MNAALIFPSDGISCNTGLLRYKTTLIKRIFSFADLEKRSLPFAGRKLGFINLHTSCRFLSRHKLELESARRKQRLRTYTRFAESLRDVNNDWELCRPFVRRKYRLQILHTHLLVSEGCNTLAKLTHFSRPLSIATNHWVARTRLPDPFQSAKPTWKLRFSKEYTI